MVNNINPADCLPHEVYEGTAYGERWTMRRAFPEAEHYRWHMSKVRPGVTGIYSRKVGDSDVSFLVRLVPAREVTRRDLPYLESIIDATSGQRAGTFGYDEAILDAVVAHLNANGGTPAGDAHGRVLDLVAEVNDLKAERDEALRERDEARRETDRWRCAHAIVEQERDTARESLRRLRDETDFDLFTVRDQLKQCRGEREQMTRDRNEWRTRAESAEARTTHTVTRDDIEKAIQGCAGWHPSAAEARMQAVGRLANAVCDLPGIDTESADPAVFVVRESDIAAVEVSEYEIGGWEGRSNGKEGLMFEPFTCTPDGLRAQSEDICVRIAIREAIARAIEAGQATDPLLDKAQEFAALADWELTDREAGLLHTVAAHVLGQETDHA